MRANPGRAGFCTVIGKNIRAEKHNRYVFSVEIYGIRMPQPSAPIVWSLHTVVLSYTHKKMPIFKRL